MTAIVEINGKKAVIKDYHWTSPDNDLARTLNGLLEPGGPSGADPNPDGTVAQDAVKKFGGRVISISPSESKTGVIY